MSDTGMPMHAQQGAIVVVRRCYRRRCSCKASCALLLLLGRSAAGAADKQCACMLGLDLRLRALFGQPWAPCPNRLTILLPPPTPPLRHGCTPPPPTRLDPPGDA